jgi:deazaflavin-dependent oxidoreductase (nitroreductase family)
MAIFDASESIANPKTFRLPFVVRIGNLLVSPLLRLGVNMGVMAALTVRGRKTGKLRTTPVAVLEVGGERYILAAFGVSDWVRNIRVARGVSILARGRRSESITASELTPQEAAPILKHNLGSAPSLVRNNFDATPDSPVEDFEREAVRHPVFQVRARDQEARV